jgi:hypothetical protein
MNALRTLPAFGFETSSCYAQHYYRQYGYAKLNRVRNPTIIDPNHANVMRVADTLYKITNIVKCRGYIPLIGTIIGINRIAEARKAST